MKNKIIGAKQDKVYNEKAKAAMQKNNVPTGHLNGKNTLLNRRSSKHLVYDNQQAPSSQLGASNVPSGNTSPKNQLKNVFENGAGSRKNSSQK